jgi:hypothetical protein
MNIVYAEVLEILSEKPASKRGRKRKEIEKFIRPFLKYSPAVAGVYRIYNHTNGKSYIGSTTDLCARSNYHRSILMSENCAHSNKELQDDFDAGHVLELEVLEVLEITEDLRVREHHYMSLFDESMLYNEVKLAPDGTKINTPQHIAAMVAGTKASAAERRATFAKEQLALWPN